MLTNRWFLLGIKIFLGIAYYLLAVTRSEPQNYLWAAVWFGAAMIDLILSFRKDKKKAAVSVQPVQSAVIGSTDKVKVMPDAFPDMPQPIGYKSTWMCIKGATPEEVIGKLGLKNAVPANWQSGLSECGNRIFVSPVVKGYVIVVGYDIFDGADAEKELLKLAEIAKGFREVQCFATHRVAEFHVWAKFSLGRLIRAYGWCDGVYMNKCSLTTEEAELYFDGLVQNDEDDWENSIIPGEDEVMKIAAAWGVDPFFSDGGYECGVGYLCDK